MTLCVTPLKKDSERLYFACLYLEIIRRFAENKAFPNSVWERGKKTRLSQAKNAQIFYPLSI
jgi:hypothetical protein